MKKLIFFEDDFKGKGFVVSVESNLFHELADIAQAKFDAWYKSEIENAPTVYGKRGKEGGWFMFSGATNSDTHTAKLIFFDVKEK